MASAGASLISQVPGVQLHVKHLLSVQPGLQMAVEVLKVLVTALTAADSLGPAAQQGIMDLLLPLLCASAAGLSPCLTL